MVTVFVGAALLGIAVGLISGLLGVGGGSLMVPIFRLVFGMSALSSTATSLFTIIPTSISGAVAHVRGKTSVPKLGIALGIGGACTSPVGVQLASMSPSWLIMVAVAIVVGYSSVTMFGKALKAAKEKPAAPAAEPADGRASESKGDGRRASSQSKDATGAIDADVSEAVFDLPPVRYAQAVGIGAVAGIASGFVGLGGGFLMIPMMVSLLRMPMKLASGTSLIAVLILVLPATIFQCVLGNVDYVAGIAMACGSVPGALVGAKFTARVPERALRFAFAALLGVTAVLLVVKETGLLGQLVS